MPKTPASVRANAFITNDPWIGAGHQNDFLGARAAVLGRRVGWVDGHRHARRRRRRPGGGRLHRRGPGHLQRAPLGPAAQVGRRRTGAPRRRGHGVTELAHARAQRAQPAGAAGGGRAHTASASTTLSATTARTCSSRRSSASSSWCAARSPAGSASCPTGPGSRKASSITTATTTSSIAFAWR